MTREVQTQINAINTMYLVCGTCGEKKVIAEQTENHKWGSPEINLEEVTWISYWFETHSHTDKPRQGRWFSVLFDKEKI